MWGDALLASRFELLHISYFDLYKYVILQYLHLGLYRPYVVGEKVVENQINILITRAK